MILLALFLNLLYFFPSIQLFFFWLIFFIIFYIWIFFTVKSWNKILLEESHNFKRELFFTVTNFCIYLLLTHILFRLYLLWYTNLFFEFWYGTILLAVTYIIGHDIYFYLLHRLLHQKWILKNIHYVHHQSHISSIWTSYSFHPIEALLYAGVIVIIFIFPINFYSLLLAVFYNDVLTILWHSWKENFSISYLKKKKIFSCLATPTYHDLHHSRSKWNYALYFLYLDKLFWTYDHNHRKIISKTEDE